MRGKTLTPPCIFGPRSSARSVSPKLLAQSFLARGPLRVATGLDHDAYSLWHSHLPARLRFPQPCARRVDRRRFDQADRPSSPIGCRFLCRGDAVAGRSRHRGPHSTTCPTSCPIRSASARTTPTRPTTPICPAALAHPDAGRAYPLQVPHVLHRQVQPGPLLLGKFRSCRHPLLRQASTASSWRRALSARRRGARGIFARGQQRRLLARQRCRALFGVLLLRLSRAAGLCVSTHKPGRGFL